jgi:hypothetical protein
MNNEYQAVTKEGVQSLVSLFLQESEIKVIDFKIDGPVLKMKLEFGDGAVEIYTLMFKRNGYADSAEAGKGFGTLPKAFGL